MMTKQQLVAVNEKGTFKLMVGVGQYDLELSGYEMVAFGKGKGKAKNLYKKGEGYILAVSDEVSEFIGYYEYKMNK